MAVGFLAFMEDAALAHWAVKTKQWHQTHFVKHIQLAWERPGTQQKGISFVSSETIT